MSFLFILIFYWCSCHILCLRLYFTLFQLLSLLIHFSYVLLQVIRSLTWSLQPTPYHILIATTLMYHLVFYHWVRVQTKHWLFSPFPGDMNLAQLLRRPFHSLTHNLGLRVCAVWCKAVNLSTLGSDTQFCGASPRPSTALPTGWSFCREWSLSSRQCSGGSGYLIFIISFIVYFYYNVDVSSLFCMINLFSTNNGLKKDEGHLLAGSSPSPPLLSLGFRPETWAPIPSTAKEITPENTRKSHRVVSFPSSN